MVGSIAIGMRNVGPGCPCFIIAEAGVNHNGSVDTALSLVHIAAEAGVDAVKFQTFSPEALASTSAPKAAYQRREADGIESQLDMLRRLALDSRSHALLMDACRARGVTFLSSPFDDGSADLLEALGVLAFKIPSGEVTNLPFLARVAAKKRPMIVSTGMATEEEVAAAVATIHGVGNSEVILLQCTSAYPASPADVNLLAMRTMAARFGTPVGYSDHTLGPAIATAAVALGASIVEKHFTLDRNQPGPDHQASATPEELAVLVKAIRDVEAALGSGRKRPAAAEADVAAVARKSLVAARNIPAGCLISEMMLSVKRPGTGLVPAEMPHVVGRRAVRDIAAGSVITWEMLA